MLFLDIETTGLDYNKHQILQLGMLHIDEKGNKKEFLRNCVYGEYTVTKKALSINKININEHEGISLPELEDEAIGFIVITEFKNEYARLYSENFSYLTLIDENRLPSLPYFTPYNTPIDESLYIQPKIITELKKDKNKIVPIGFNVGSFDMLFIKKYLPEFYKFFAYRSVDLNSLIYLEAKLLNMKFNDRKVYYKDKFEMSHNALDDCKQSYNVFKEILSNLECKSKNDTSLLYDGFWS